MGVSSGEEFLDTLHPLFTTLHLSWFGGGCVINLWFTLFLLLEELEYVVGRASIFGRTTAVVRLHNSWYAHAQQVMCMRWSTVMRQLLFRLMTHPPQGRLAVLRCNLRLLVFGIGEEWWRVVKSRCKLFTTRNADKHRGFRRKGEEWRVKACSLADKKMGRKLFPWKESLAPLILLLMSKWAP